MPSNFRQKRKLTITGGGGCADAVPGRYLRNDQIDTRSRNLVSAPLGSLTIRPGMKTLDPAVVAAASHTIIVAQNRYICMDDPNGVLVYTVDGGISGSYAAGLKMFYKFSDDMVDATANNNDLTAAGGVSYSTTTPITTGNKVVDLDGTDGKGSLAHASTTGVELGDEFTAWVWVNLDGLTNTKQSLIIGKCDTTTPGGWRFHTTETATTYTVQFDIYWATTGAVEYTFTGAVVGTSEDHFFAVRFKKALSPAATLDLYWGERNASSDALRAVGSYTMNESPAQGTGNLLLGYDATLTGADYLDGKVFEPGLCNTWLTVAQLTQIYTEGVDAVLGA